MKTLHLNLHKKWFDMTESGEKTEDYREITNYWFKRLFGLYVTDPNTGKLTDPYSTISQNSDLILAKHNPIEFDTNTLSNGYTKNRPQFVVEFKGIEIREGRPEWGAEPGKKYFVIKHGKKL